ncbi:MAG: L-alanine-DL-glutamate epimerase, partial [Bacillota bacterium]
MVAFTDYRFTFERQPLARPFHFKGGFFTEKWINVVRLRPGGATAVGGNAVLWSDAAVFHGWSETGGNTLMTLLAERAVQLARGVEFTDPIDAFSSVREELHEYAPRITLRPEVTRTFTLNAMVALDFALWKL